MQLLTLDDPEWLTTFPYRLVPYRDEWLASVLLRCDEDNYWESGTTLRFLIHATNHPGFGPRSSLIVVPRAVLDYLAQCLMISSERLLATTYTTELTRLYPPAWYSSEKEPHPGPLLGLHYRRENWPRGYTLELKEITNERRLHLCSACIAQTGSMRRTVTLPHLQSCPIHQVALQERCPCGKPVSFFSQGKPPFTCGACGLNWAQWPQTELPLEQMALEHTLIAFYELFLQKGTPMLRSFALRLARQRLKGTEFLQLKLSEKTMKSVAIYRGRHFSLGYLVDILVSTGVSPDEVMLPQYSL